MHQIKTAVNVDLEFEFCLGHGCFVKNAPVMENALEENLFKVRAPRPLSRLIYKIVEVGLNSSPEY
jgi:hypothetical protein